ncbi:MAG: glycosyltransferase [bacterium]|nr:glycosyltransferase [bacterium]
MLEAVERHFAAYAAKSQGGSEEADLSEIQMLLNLEELRTRRQFSEKDHVINLQAARIAELERMRTTRLYRLITGFNKICFRPFARLFRFFLAKMQQVLRILTGRRRHPFLSISNGAYQRWITKKELSDDDLVILKKSCDNLAQQRLISIVVPVFNTDIRWLDAAIDSVTAQVYQNWELCLVNDGSTEPHVREALESYKAKDKRIKIKHLGRNHGIAGATNAALGMAEGEFIAFMDSDDTLHNTALAEIVLLLHKQPDTDIVFTDEDKLTLDGKRRKPVFKPGWSAEKFLTCNYINHLTVCRKTLVDKVGGFRAEFDWSQDYDLYLRMVEQTENDKIIHLPKVLYHWRMVPGSSAAKVDTRAEALAKSKLLLQETLRRRGIKGTVTEGLQPGTFKIKRA